MDLTETDSGRRLLKALTYQGRRTPPPPRLWRVKAWDRERRRVVHVGYLVTSNESARLRGVLAPWPRAIAFVYGTNLYALRVAKSVDADHSEADKRRPSTSWRVIDCRQVLPSQLAGMLLLPMRSNGDLWKLSRQKFPAAMYQHCEGRKGAYWRSLTHAEVAEMTEQKNSGTPQEPRHAQLAGNSVNKGNPATAAYRAA